MKHTPKNLKVGPHTYTIRTGPKAELDVTLTARCELYGATDHKSLAIFVSDRQAASQARDTLLHEALHAILDVTGISHECEGDEEERLIRRLSPALLQLLRDNPVLVQFLTAG